MGKVWKYLLLLLLGLLLVASALPYILVPDPYSLRVKEKIQAPAEDLFQVLEDVRTWPAWAWPWSQDTAAEVVWYDKTTGEMAGFYWKSMDPAVGEGVVEIRALVPPQRLEGVMIQGNQGDQEFHYSLRKNADSLTTLVWSSRFFPGTYPWERVKFWFDLKPLKKQKKQQVQNLGAFVRARLDSLAYEDL